MGGTRLLVIGLDAAESSIVLDLLRCGHMPAVRELADRGCQARLEAPADVYVGAVWPSLFTGASPAQHGRWAPQVLRVGTYETEWRGSETAIEPFWAHLGRAGLEVAAIDVPLAPLVRMPKVVQLSEWTTHDKAAPTTRWFDDGPDPFGTLPVAPVDSCDAYHRAGRLDDLRSALLAGIERKTALTERLLDRRAWDLLITVYGESHCVGHQCWHLHDPTHPRYELAQAAELGDPITDVYRALDEAVARLCARVDRDTTVVIVCSHGMGPHYDGTHLLGEILRRIEDTVLGPLRPLSDGARQPRAAWLGSVVDGRHHARRERSHGRSTGVADSCEGRTPRLWVVFDSTSWVANHQAESILRASTTSCAHS